MFERYDSNLILDYIEEELSPQEKAGFEQLLAQDGELRTLVEQLQQDRQILRQMPIEQAPAEVLERVQQRMERNMLLDAAPVHVADRDAVRRFRIGRWLAYGSMAAMVAVSGIIIFQTLAPWNGANHLDSLTSRTPMTEGAADDVVARRMEREADAQVESVDEDLPATLAAVPAEGASESADAAKLSLPEEGYFVALGSQVMRIEVAQAGAEMRRQRGRAANMMQVQAEDGELARRQVEHWAISNNIAVHQPREGSQLAMVVPSRQVPELMEQLHVPARRDNGPLRGADLGLYMRDLTRSSAPTPVPWLADRDEPKRDVSQLPWDALVQSQLPFGFAYPLDAPSDDQMFIIIDFSDESDAPAARDD